jgi:hypothetical protein
MGGADLRLIRHCERSEAIHGAASGEMDCFVASAPRNDDWAYHRILAAYFLREVSIYSRPLNKGRGECRALDAPAASRAK